ncbi:MAG TPA: hypothetical protein VFD42_03710, partial [Chloroflexota bacterium]|nr:hypothetical protein [Chloroflexota bacterium]
IKAAYFADADPIAHFGLPVSYADMGNSFVIRAQRATFQYWKEDVPWAKQGEVSVANGGDLAKEIGLWPFYATTPEPQPQLSGAYRAQSPEYGVIPFLIGSKNTTQRDLEKMLDAGFGWQKSLFQWYWIEHAGKGQFNWVDTDRVVQASNALGIKVIARMDFPPDWARADKSHNGPPDSYQDYADFVYATVDRYKTGSPYGRVHAVELWNEANLAREWGNRKPNAAEYVQLLKAGYEAAKRADPNITVIGASLTPTGTYDDSVTPDDVFLQQMYDAGGKAYFDVLGAHGAGYKAPPSMSPEQAAADPSYGGNRIFTFRRVEDLRAVMVRNDDSGKQIWLTEFGWTSDPIHPDYAWHRVTEEQKAQYIVDAYRWAKDNWSPWIGVMALWNMPDPTWTQEREEYWWSITNPDSSNRPAFDQLKAARQNGTLP